jgi:Opacity protein and related surface antigens
MTLKPFALALVAAFSAAPVLAADAIYDEPSSYNEPPASTSSSGWTGAYVGIHAGMGSERSSPFSGDKEFVGGIQGGYNAELGGAVVGGELEYSHMGDTEVRVPGGDLKERHRVAAKAKVGMPMGETLLYGTAGMAMTSVRDGDNGIKGPDGWKPGYLLGLGVEQNLTGNVSAKVEYNYVRTPDVRSTDGVTNSETNVSDHTIKAGLNYKF